MISFAVRFMNWFEPTPVQKKYAVYVAALLSDKLLDDAAAPAADASA